jgi:hypothetical protein
LFPSLVGRFLSYCLKSIHAVLAIIYCFELLLSNLASLKYSFFSMAAASYYQPTLHIPQHEQQQTGSYTMHPINPSYDTPLPPLEDPVSPIGYAASQKPPNPAQRPIQFKRLRAQRYEKFKRWLRILRILSQLASILFSTIMFAIMVFVLFKYQSTKNLAQEAKSGVHSVISAWPKNTKLWPTIMLLAGAGMSLLVSAVTFLTYCPCWKRARQSWKITVLRYAIHILAWLVITTLYRYEKSLHGVNNDLWGWSCVHEADTVQTAFPQLNFKALCDVQVRHLRSIL